MRHKGRGAIAPFQPHHAGPANGRTTMARFILIDHASGYIYADTADLNGPARDESAIEAVRRFDESIGESRREYEEHGQDHVPATGLNVSAYHVYCDDIATSEAVPVVY